MRAVVIILACLAIAKIWAHDHFYRAATNAALIDAFRPQAEKTCAREATKLGAARNARWLLPESGAISIGGNFTSVMIWDVNNPLWDVRYRHPHLTITTTTPRKLTCSFDLAVGLAFVKAL